MKEPLVLGISKLWKNSTGKEDPKLFYFSKCF
jgi:hypothetical protein